MNLDFKNFLKRKKIFRKNNTEPNPNIYWVFIFYGGLLLTILAFVFGFYLFMNINKEDNSSPIVNNKQLNKISPKRIDKILDLFHQREETSNTILSSPSPSVDPSL